MTLHAALDRWTIALSRRLFRRSRYFRGGVASPSLADHLAGVRLGLPRLTDDETYYPLTAETLIGPLEAGFRVARWAGERAPTLIYHHGTSESPFDASFRALLGGRRRPRGAVNLLVVRAPFAGSFREFLAGIAELRSYAAMLMVSVAVIDALVADVRGRGSPRVIVAGLSLGGFITNLHCLHRGSADAYAPLLAGAAIGSLFTEGIYRGLVDPGALEQAAAIREVLDFEAEFVAGDRSRVAPLLARHDLLVEYDRQRAAYQAVDPAGEPTRDPQPLVTLNRGHVTGALAYRQLRQHLLATLGPLADHA